MGEKGIEYNMAQQANDKPVKQTVHAYKFSAKMDQGELIIWVSDKITKKRWESKFNKGSFPNQELKDVFAIIQKAVSSKPPGWAATYPQDDTQGLFVDVEDGTLEFELPEVKFDANDIF